MKRAPCADSLKGPAPGQHYTGVSHHSYDCHHYSYVFPLPQRIFLTVRTQRGPEHNTETAHVSLVHSLMGSLWLGVKFQCRQWGLIICTFNSWKFCSSVEKRRRENNANTAIKCCKLYLTYILYYALYITAYIILCSILITLQDCIHNSQFTFTIAFVVLWTTNTELEWTT